MLYGRLLDKNSYRCEPLTDLSYPVILLQRGESRGDRFIESLRRDLYGVLNVSDIFYRNCARSEDHKQERSIFAFCSPVKPDRDPGSDFAAGLLLRIHHTWEHSDLEAVKEHAYERRLVGPCT